jgi:hypothetical protein
MGLLKALAVEARLAVVPEKGKDCRRSQSRLVGRVGAIAHHAIIKTRREEGSL